MKGYVVVVKFEINPIYLKDFLKLINRNAEMSLLEDNCLQFDIASKDNSIFLYEIYRNKDAFDYHKETDHYKDFQDNANVYIISKSVETYILDFHGIS